MYNFVDYSLNIRPCYFNYLKPVKCRRDMISDRHFRFGFCVITDQNEYRRCGDKSTARYDDDDFSVIESARMALIRGTVSLHTTGVSPTIIANGIFEELAAVSVLPSPPKLLLSAAAASWCCCCWGCGGGVFGRLADRRGELVRLLTPPTPATPTGLPCCRRSYTNNRFGLEFCFLAGILVPVAKFCCCWSDDCGRVVETPVADESSPKTGALSVPCGILFGSTDCASRAHTLFDSRCRLTRVCKYGKLVDDDGEAGVPAGESELEVAAAAAAADLRSRLLWNEFHRRMGSKKYCRDFRDEGLDNSGLDSFFNIPAPILHFDDLRLSDTTAAAAANGNRCRCCCSMRFSSCLECFFIFVTGRGAACVSGGGATMTTTLNRTTNRRERHARFTTVGTTVGLRVLAETHPRRCDASVCVCVRVSRCGHAHARWHVVRRCQRRQGRPVFSFLTRRISARDPSATHARHYPTTVNGIYIYTTWARTHTYTYIII